MSFHDPKDYEIEDIQKPSLLYDKPNWSILLNNYRKTLFAGKYFCFEKYNHRSLDNDRSTQNQWILTNMIEKLGGKISRSIDKFDYIVFETTEVDHRYKRFKRGNRRPVHHKFIIDTFCCLVHLNPKKYTPIFKNEDFTKEFNWPEFDEYKFGK